MKIKQYRKRQSQLSPIRKRCFPTSPIRKRQSLLSPISKATLRNVACIAFFCLSSWLSSTTWHIKQDGTGNFTTIQEGINASVDADTVLVYPGTYFENLDLNGHNITLASLELTTGDEQYINSTIIDGQNLESCIRIHNGETDAHVQGFTVQNGYGTHFWSEDGGGFLVHDYSTVYITNCIIKDNVATLGAGIYARHGFLHLSGLRITHNSAGYGGAIYAADDSTINFDADNRCNIYNNNAGKGADLFSMESEQIDVIVDTFSVFEPSRYFAEYLEGSTYTFDIQHNWMELVPHDLYVHPSGDDENNGLTPEEPLKNISWAVRKIQADSLNHRTVHVASGYYSHQINGQIFPIGCKEYVSIIGEDMDNTILINDYSPGSIRGYNLDGNVEISNFTIQHNPERFTSSVMLFYEIELLRLSNIKIQDNSNISGILKNGYSFIEYDTINIFDNVVDGLNSGLFFSKIAGYMKNCNITNNQNIESDPNSIEVALQLLAYDDIVLENCIFSGNHSSNSEGRIIRTTNHNGTGPPTTPTITFNNCLISDNSIGSRYVFQSLNHDGLTEFNNCTFANNTAESNFYPSTIYSKSYINMNNTIMHNNTDYEIFMADDTINGYNYVLNVDHSYIKNGFDGIYNVNNSNIINWGDNNISDYPVFDSLGTYPYALLSDSPCIDTGTPDTTGLFLLPWDLLHNYRVWDGDDDGEAIIDMGCYEYGADSVGVNNYQLPITNYELSNYPNPFNPVTKIVFELPESGQVKLDIYNIKGQKVKTLLDCYMSPGRSEMIWNSRDDKGKKVSSGVYFYKLQTGNKIITKKMLLLK